MSEATGIALATNRDERRRNSLRVAVRAAVLVLTLATMTLTTAAWADQATATTNSQSGPTTMTRTGPTATTTRTGPTATTTKTGPTATTRSSTIPNPLPRSIPVTATPQAAGAGTTVKVTADVRGCDRVHAFFYDRKSKGSGVDGGGRPLDRLRITGNRWLAAQYNVTRSHAVGQGRFGVLCNLHYDNYREGYATFQVKAGDASNDSGSGDNPAAGTNNSTVQGPSSDAGLDGTAARTSGGLVWLLLPAGLLLIALAAWLRLRQATARRRW
jgi:hypothetical protein